MMAICHTAVPERTDGKITYQAASPGTSHPPQAQQNLNSTNTTLLCGILTLAQSLSEISLNP